MSKNVKINLFIGAFVFGLVFVTLFLYLYLLPKAVSSKIVQDVVIKEFYKLTQASLVIENPVLKTKLSPIVEFSVDKIEINKAQENYLTLNKFDIALSFAKLLTKRVELRNLAMQNFYIDATKLITLFPAGEQKESQPCDWEFGFFNSDIDVDKVQVLYDANGVLFDVNIKDITLSKGQKKNYMHFVTNVFVTKGKHTIRVSISDENKVYIERDKLVINRCNLRLNESVVNINAMMDKKNRFDINVFSKNFKVENVIDIIESNILIPNGSELLGMFSDIKGLFDFNFNLNNKGQNGQIDIKKVSLGLVPMNNIPLTVRKGSVKITNKDIFLTDFVAYYNKHPYNDIKLTGTVKDYMKTFDTNVDVNAKVSNDFMQHYLSKMVGYPIGLQSDADTKLNVKMKNNVIDMRWIFWVNEDNDLFIGGEPLSTYKLQRVLLADVQIKDMMLDLKNLNYYIKVPNTQEKIYKKLLQLTGKVDFSKGINFKEMGFEVSEPLPSEFLNMVARADLFKGGTVVGKLKAIDGPKGVKLFGNINLEKFRIPSQRIYVEKGTLATKFDNINIKANGRYRRTKYNLDGEFVNNIAFPIIINKLNLAIDKINIGKMIESMNMQGETTAQQADLSDDDDVVPTFDASNLIIKNCSFKMDEGLYNDIIIKDLMAKMTLNEQSVLELQSNRFGFAEGISSCKVICDLKKHFYKVLLGVNNVDSNIVASSLLGLKDEISGRARGYINLHTDSSLKLNGSMGFEIKDGTIGTVGFLQYVLNMASIFRNPLAMLSPTTIWDLINIPEGNFNKISGKLQIKDNVIERINIKSQAPQLSSYIAGRFDLENRDASLRIYTKFSNKKSGVYGVLRNISLSQLASYLPLTNRTLYNLYNQEVKEIPEIEADEKDCQIYLTKAEGDIERNNFISSLKRIK